MPCPYSMCHRPTIPVVRASTMPHSTGRVTLPPQVVESSRTTIAASVAKAAATTPWSLPTSVSERGEVGALYTTSTRTRTPTARTTPTATTKASVRDFDLSRTLPLVSSADCLIEIELEGQSCALVDVCEYTEGDDSFEADPGEVRVENLVVLLCALR